jgi:ankyrin repeat protein
MTNSIFSFIVSGDKNAVIKLIEKDKTIVNITDKMGRTPLMEAVIQRNFEICKELIDTGATVNCREKRNWTALHFAAQEYDFKIAELLLSSGAEVDAEDDNGNTPLFRSLFGSKGKGEVIKLLLQNGANREHKNKSGISPLELALQVTNFDLERYFVDVVCKDVEYV